jgi:hypothetical protein
MIVLDVSFQTLPSVEKFMRHCPIKSPLPYNCIEDGSWFPRPAYISYRWRDL